MIIKVKGGLGNQMFQYAYSKMMELVYNKDDVKLDFSYYSSEKSKNWLELDDLNVNYLRAPKNEINRICYFSHEQTPYTLPYLAMVWLEKTLNRKYYFNTTFDYIDPLTLMKYDYIDGAWQCWRYFEDIRDVLLKDFTLRKETCLEFKKVEEKFHNENAVFIGVRRGDYVESKSNLKLYGVFSNEYYINAIKYIVENTDNPKFYIFSNDINWVKENMKFPCEVNFREKKDILSSAQELILMSNCKHAIIPNSTFHWWAAWLIKNDNKIIVAPDIWFADGTAIDAIPPEWVRFTRNGEIISKRREL